jgi:hypothetical protein
MGRSVYQVPTSTLKPRFAKRFGAFLICKSLIINKMKQIELKPTEFYQFRQLAFAMCIAFVCTMAQGVYIVEASIDQLEQLGY